MGGSGPDESWHKKPTIGQQSYAPRRPHPPRRAKVKPLLGRTVKSLTAQTSNKKRYRAHTRSCKYCIKATTTQIQEWGIQSGVVKPTEEKAVYHRVYEAKKREQIIAFEKDLAIKRVWYRHPQHCEGYPSRGNIKFCTKLRKWFYTRQCIKHHGLAAQYVCKPYHDGIKIDDTIGDGNIIEHSVALEDSGYVEEKESTTYPEKDIKIDETPSLEIHQARQWQEEHPSLLIDKGTLASEYATLQEISQNEILNSLKRIQELEQMVKNKEESELKLKARVAELELSSREINLKYNNVVKILERVKKELSEDNSNEQKVSRSKTSEAVDLDGVKILEGSKIAEELVKRLDNRDIPRKLTERRTVEPDRHLERRKNDFDSRREEHSMMDSVDAQTQGKFSFGILIDQLTEFEEVLKELMG